MSTEKTTLRSRFNHFARQTSMVTGHPFAFLIAVAIIIVWAITGPIFGFNDTWQLVINTGTTIVTFLMVFLIQNTQNRDSLAMQIKMDEVIRAVQGAHNSLLNLEEMDDKELEALHKKYEGLAEQARQHLEKGGGDIDSPELDEQDKPVESTSESVHHEVNGSTQEARTKPVQVKLPRKHRRSKKSA
jgi:low affinity Fe/Cu permease